MNDSNKENIELNEEEFSTVFSDPIKHKKAAQSIKRKKRLPVIISCFLAVAILIGGTIGIIKLVPERETNKEQAPSYESIEVLNLDSDELETVTVQNENGGYKLYSVKEKEDSSSSSSASVVNWYLDGYEKNLISTTATLSAVDTLADITALKEITKMTADDCGLTNAKTKAVLLNKDGEEITLLFGTASLDDSGYYFKTSNSDKIYLIESYYISTANQSVLDFGDTSNMPAFPLTSDMTDFKNNDGELLKFEKLTISGKNFPTALVIEENPNKTLIDLVGYITTSPTKHIAAGTDDIFDMFKFGLTTSGVYSFNKSASSLKEFGLDNPDFTVTMEIKGITHTYKFKKQNNDYCAVICDGVDLIKKVASTSIGFIDYVTKDFYSSWVCLISIDDISSLVIKSPESTDTFEFSNTKGENEEEILNVSHNGNEFDTDTFKNFYQQLISIPCSDYTIDNILLKADYSFTFNFKEEIGGKNVIEFVKVTETRYQYYSDGVAMGKVTSAELKKIFNALEKLTD